MRCPKCDIRYESDVSFCAECGTRLIKSRSLDENTGRIKKDHLHNKSNTSKRSVNLELTKLDKIIEQNSRIIELLEEIARK